MSLNLFLIVISQLGLTYLIYRYARYSKWRSTQIGKAFMAMKLALWSLLTFVIVARFLPDNEFWDLVAAVLLGFMAGAIAFQIRAVLYLQGGFLRQGQKTDSGQDVHRV